jgi:hypothetical protein
MSNITKLELIDKSIRDDDNIFEQIQGYANTLKEV